jgi:hypothetical protein
VRVRVRGTQISAWLSAALVHVLVHANLFGLCGIFLAILAALVFRTSGYEKRIEQKAAKEAKALLREGYAGRAVFRCYAGRVREEVFSFRNCSATRSFNYERREIHERGIRFLSSFRVFRVFRS